MSAAPRGLSEELAQAARAGRLPAPELLARAEVEVEEWGQVEGLRWPLVARWRGQEAAAAGPRGLAPWLQRWGLWMEWEGTMQKRGTR